MANWEDLSVEVFLIDYVKSESAENVCSKRSPFSKIF